MGYYSYDFRWAPYVPVAQKRAKAQQLAIQVARQQERKPAPVVMDGRTIAKSFWGKAWCDNLQAYSDFSNRLPRGATYLRNGSVADLVIQPGSIEAIVAGSNPYRVKIKIAKLNRTTWTKLKKECAASIDSLLDLLGGQLSDSVLQRLTAKRGGCFPTPEEIEMQCSCPDYSYCCKHIAAVMYGVGNRLDTSPELLFVLRGVNQMDLISRVASPSNLSRELKARKRSTLANKDIDELGQMFGIELESAMDDAESVPTTRLQSSAGRRSGRTVQHATAKTRLIAKTAHAANKRKQFTSKVADPKITAAVIKETPMAKATKKKAIARSQRTSTVVRKGHAEASAAATSKTTGKVKRTSRAKLAASAKRKISR